MKVYCISYDLRAPLRDYTGVYNALKASHRWWHFLESTWLIQTAETPDQVWSRLAGHIDQNDRLLIIEVKKNAHGWLPQEAWDWIRLHIPDF